MWMNEYEIEDAERRYRTHPVLGPASRTLANLVRWTNSNSDGWTYWQAPGKAAHLLMQLVQGNGLGATIRPGRPDATVERYKAALRPLKSFRTKRENQAGPGLRPIFEIIEPGPGVGGEVWAAEQAYADACRVHEQAYLRERAADELRQRAAADLDYARYRQNWHDLAEDEADTADPGTARAIALGKPGTRLWVIPAYTHEGYQGLGQPATALGVKYGMGGASVVYKTASGEISSTGLMVLMTLASARERYWVTDAAGTNLVTGGSRDPDRMDAMAYERTIEDGELRVVLPGTAFIPAGQE